MTGKIEVNREWLADLQAFFEEAFDGGIEGILQEECGIQIEHVRVLLAAPEAPRQDVQQMASMPVERCYDVRTKMIIAFNESRKNGGDLDDGLDAAYKAALRYSPAPLSPDHSGGGAGMVLPAPTPYQPKGEWAFERCEDGAIVIKNGKDWTVIKSGDGPIYEQFLYRFCEQQMKELTAPTINENSEFERWRNAQIDVLIRNGYPEGAEAFRNLGSVQWAGWQARACLDKVKELNQ